MLVGLAAVEQEERLARGAQRVDGVDVDLDGQFGLGHRLDPRGLATLFATVSYRARLAG
jgi:hypothetical protein